MSPSSTSRQSPLTTRPVPLARPTPPPTPPSLARPSPPAPPPPPPAAQSGYRPSPSHTPANRTPSRSPSIVQQQQQQPSYSPLPPARQVAVSPGPGLAATPSMLQSQLERLQDTSRRPPVRNQEQPQPGMDRRNSYAAPAADNIRSRMVNKTKTPTFGELQFRYGKDYKSPSPVLDRDYQKEARKTVVGELSRCDLHMFILLRL